MRPTRRALRPMPRVAALVPPFRRPGAANSAYDTFKQVARRKLRGSRALWRLSRAGTGEGACPEVRLTAMARRRARALISVVALCVAAALPAAADGAVVRLGSDLQKPANWVEAHGPDS